jgi:2-oxoglutarate/2-oxoacid ferredoxin oxidoreductase subunit alpha
MSVKELPVTAENSATTRKVNDFSIVVATVNGSGSQTANGVILRALFTMGIPVSGKNLFPSNIQGLPTWFTIRANAAGFVARTDQSEILVAMNRTTVIEDLKTVAPGGACLYADDMAFEKVRRDVHYYPIPAARLARESGAEASLRAYVANMAYVGALAWLLGIELGEIEKALGSHFRGKSKAVALNFGVVQAAHRYAQENLTKGDAFRAERMPAASGMILVDGNTAAALGAIYGGLSFEAWYPITPASSLAEALQEYLPQLRRDPVTGENHFLIVQAEDELGALGMAVGAGWMGARSMTSTSGPGLSLMAEFSGLAHFAEVPVVIWDVQRMGPSTGLPTRVSQGDLLFAHFIGHGDGRQVVLLPGPNDCFEFGWRAFDLAERLQAPIFVLSDLDLGMNLWRTPEFRYPDKPMDRGKVLSAEDLTRLGGFARYKDVDGDGIGWRTLPGTLHPRAAYFTRGTGHDENALYSEDPAVWEANMARLARKYQTAKSLVPEPIIERMSGAHVGLIGFGSTDPAIQEARHLLMEAGRATDYLRLRAIPFADEVGTFLSQHPVNWIVELNSDGQMHSLLKIDFAEHAGSMRSLAHNDGLPLTARRVVQAVLGEKESGR